MSMSGERFSVSYLLCGDSNEARRKAEDICLEQTVEFPADLVPPGEIRDHIIGRLEGLEKIDEGLHRARISFAAETTAGNLVQLLNVVFGNISLKPGIKVESLALPAGMISAFKGPRLGRAGLRSLLGVLLRPLTCTALKPMGLSASELAGQAHRFALGGIDIVKDDHGITNQFFSPFAERVQRCAEAVQRANRETGGRSIYMPNVTGPVDALRSRAILAKSAGAGALLVCPHLVGIDSMRSLADDDRIALPIMAHSSFGGSFVTSKENGMNHGLFFGQLMRLAGADATVFPNYGGRFSFSREECAEISRACAEELHGFKPIFPAPGGGMTADRAKEMFEVYGRDFILLIGAGLHRLGPDLAENSRRFRGMLEAL
jgi:ribulose-bisphosphate carboxylase large chain